MKFSKIIFFSIINSISCTPVPPGVGEFVPGLVKARIAVFEKTSQAAKSTRNIFGTFVEKGVTHSEGASGSVDQILEKSLKQTTKTDSVNGVVPETAENLGGHSKLGTTAEKSTTHPHEPPGTHPADKLAESLPVTQNLNINPNDGKTIVQGTVVEPPPETQNLNTDSHIKKLRNDRIKIGLLAGSTAAISSGVIANAVAMK